MKRDLAIEDMDGWLNHNQQERSWNRFGDNNVSRYEQEEEGSILGAARWLAIAFVLAVLCAIAGMWMAS